MVARGDPSGYIPEAISSAKSLEELTAHVTREFFRISDAITRGLAHEVEFLHVEPIKQYDGLTVGADGTNWNPGAGQGVYTYYAAAWHKLG